jgi:hypothetical protein
LAWSVVIGSGIALSLAHCGSDDSAATGAADGGSDRSAPDGKSTYDGSSTYDASSPQDASKPKDASGEKDANDGAVTAPQLNCSPTATIDLDELGRDGDNHLIHWIGRMRVVRLGANLARTIAQKPGESPTVYTFDPSVATPTPTKTPLPLDVVLDTTHEGGALWVFGVRIGTSDAGPPTALVLTAIDDETGALATTTLTTPGTIGANPVYNHYQGPMGRFARFGSGDVYFAYTEELGTANNPSYKLHVGRVTASSGPVATTGAATADPHKFEDITPAAVVHAGSSAHVFMGASGVSDSSDDMRTAVQWILPDDATVPGTVTKRGLQGGLLAAGRDGDVTRFVFVEPPNIFGDPRYFYVGSANEASMPALAESTTGITTSNAAAKVTLADSHLEGEHFLWFGPRQGLWLDTSIKQVRAFFGPMKVGSNMNPVDVAAVTFGAAPTLTSGELNLVYAHGEANRTLLRFVALTCAP